MLAKLIAIYAAVQSKDYQAAAKALWSLVGEIMGWSPTPATFAADGMFSDEDMEACLDECEKIEAAMKSAPKTVGADPSGNAAIWLMLIQTLLPLVLDWLKKRRDG